MAPKDTDDIEIHENMAHIICLLLQRQNDAEKVMAQFFNVDVIDSILKVISYTDQEYLLKVLLQSLAIITQSEYTKYIEDLVDNRHCL